MIDIGFAAFVDGSFELFLQDRETGASATIEGEMDKKKALEVEKVLPMCVVLEADQQEPDGWLFELATAISYEDPNNPKYVNWDEEPRFSRTKPNVPAGSIRNLRPLYAGRVINE